MTFISVCMPVWNGSSFLDRAFECLSQQTHKDFEIILVDDGSKDDSAEKAKRLMSHHGLTGRVITTENQGCEQARDLACAYATAAIIAPFDCDDWWEPEYLASMLSALKSHPDIDLVYCDFSEENTETGMSARKSDTAHWIDLSLAARDGDVYRFNQGAFFPLLLQGQVLFPPCTMFKRSLYEKAGIYADLADLRISLDWSFGLRASKVGVVAFLHRPLLRKFIHGGNVSGDPIRTCMSDLRVMDSLVSKGMLSSGERRQLMQLAARRATLIAYAFRVNRRQNWQSFAWSLRSLRYQWNMRAVRMAVTALMPPVVLSRMRGAMV
jgi:glycosyltransferase involved in cell wall biosynthesis